MNYKSKTRSVMKKVNTLLGLMLFVSGFMLVSCEKDYMEDDYTEEVVLVSNDGAISKIIESDGVDKVKVD